MKTAVPLTVGSTSDGSTRSLFKELKERTDSYLKSQGRSRTNTAWSLFNAFVLCTVWGLTYAAYLYFGSQHWAIALSLAVVWAVIAMVVQFSVMHDGSHGAASTSSKVNALMTFPIQFLGGSAILWKAQHCAAHHSYTNIHGEDHDVNAGALLRLHPAQPLRSFHRYQHLYAWVLYGLFIHQWVWWGDFRDVIYNTYGLPKKTLRKALIETTLIKVWHVGFFIVLPLMVFPEPWVAIVGYLVSFSLLGFLMAVVFQLAHVSNVQAMPNHRSDLDSDWAVRQLATTANFAPKNRLLSWATGSLNYQIEHHIFPMMSHINYPRIAPVIKEVCRERGIEYAEFSSVYEALRAHTQHLKRLGAS